LKLYDDTRDAIFGELYLIALNDPNVIVLTADTGALIFNEFKKNIPEQFYNLGVAEQNAISVAAGLALSGKQVFVYAITTFVTLRCYEQIKIDICCMDLPVTILGMGTGYVYSPDGPTHHMTEDLSIMRALPGLNIWSPSDYTMAASSVHMAYQLKKPCYIRFDKGPFSNLYDHNNPDFSNGLTMLKPGNDITLISTGIMVDQAFKVAEELGNKEIKAGVVDVYRLKPVNKKLLIETVRGSKQVAVIEEHTIMGGLGSMVCEVLAEGDVLVPTKLFGIPDTYHCEVGSREMLRKLDKIDVDSIAKSLLSWIH
jgi:transketolase